MTENMIVLLKTSKSIYAGILYMKVRVWLVLWQHKQFGSIGSGRCVK